MQKAKGKTRKLFLNKDSLPRFEFLIFNFEFSSRFSIRSPSHLSCVCGLDNWYPAHDRYPSHYAERSRIRQKPDCFLAPARTSSHYGPVNTKHPSDVFLRYSER